MTTTEKINFLITEYQQCNRGYAFRDQLAHNACRGIIQTFSVFLTLLLAATVFIEVSRSAHISLCIILGFIGLLSMFTLLLDLESTASCKVALRERCLEIESEVGSPNMFKMWSVIERRGKFFEERLFKGDPANADSRIKDRPEPEYGLFVVAARVVVLLWILLVISVAKWGPSIRLAAQ